MVYFVQFQVICLYTKLNGIIPCFYTNNRKRQTSRILFDVLATNRLNTNNVALSEF